MKKILLLLLFLISHILNAQDMKVVPPSPEAASAFKFTEVPVSAYTGLPNISLPLYEIKLKNMSIPINIAYHARGIKVEEMASSVGLGWALNYGGMISRQIRGRADDYGSVGFLKQGNGYYDGIFTDANIRNMWTDNVTYFNIDTQPDMFMFDLNGQSGKYMFDSKETNGVHKVLMQKFQDIDFVAVLATDETIRGWIVTDEGGNKFYFGCNKDKNRDASDQDWTINNFTKSYNNAAELTSSPAEDERNINTWHLMEIETVFNERVEFFYEEESSRYYRRSYDKNENSDVFSSYSEINSHQFHIKQIIFDGGKVNFTKSSNMRLDVEEGQFAVDNVAIYNKENELLKRYNFQYHYTTATAGNTNLNSSLYLREPQANKRLFLSSVQEEGRLGETLPATSFEYSSILLPNRFSNSQDIWGYYNGKQNGPYLSFYNYGNFQINREVDTLLSEAGLLKKVTWPTGGSVKYTYEHNRGIVPGFMNKLFFLNANPTQNVTKVDGFLKSTQYYDSQNLLYKKDIVIGSNKVGPVQFEMKLPYCDQSNSMAECNYQVFLENANGSTMIYPTGLGNPATLNIPSGNYTLKVIPAADHDPANFANTFYAKLEWTESTVNSGGETGTGGALMFAAGKRVKRIEYVNEDNTVQQKNYTYTDPTGRSSGNMYGLPNLYFKLWQYDSNGVQVWPVLDKYGSMPGSPLTSLQGNGVGYGFVTEYFGEQSSNTGKIDYEFTTTPDGGKYYERPFYLPIDNEWLRGKNTSTSIYENVGGSYLLKKNTLNRYSYAGVADLDTAFTKYFTTATANHTIDRKRFSLPLLVGPVNGPIYMTYYQTGGVSDIYSTIETSFENGNKILKKQTNYYYDYENHYLPSIIETINSDGTKTSNFTSYPNSYPAGTTFLDNLKSNHILNVPVEHVTYKDAGGVKSILGGEIKKYKTDGKALIDEVFKLETSAPVPLAQFQFSNQTAAVLPSGGASSVFSPDSRYQSSIVYNSYGDKATLLQHTRTVSSTTNGPSTSYIWDYNNQYPIAEVQNAVQSDIAYTSFETDISGNWGYTGRIMALYNVTGSKSLFLGASGSITKAGLNPARQYQVLMWYKSVNGAPGSGFNPIFTQAGTGWTLYEKKFSGVNTFSFSATNAYIDEIRLCPTDAQMSTYTYDPLIGMLTSADAKGQITYFEYDNFQRLRYVKDQNLNIVKNVIYHFGASGNVTSPEPLRYLNTYQDTIVIPACNTPGQVGSPYTYSVVAGTYSSWVSQEEADNKARTDLRINAQSQANYNGICQTACTGPDKKMINGICRTGVKVYTESTLISNSPITYACVYHYKWIDDSVSEDYYEYGPNSCPVFSGN